MVYQKWHNRLREELSKRSLPPAYSARLLDELADHISDLQQENLSMDAQTNAEDKLGSPESLAATAEKEYRRRTFAGRHPFLTFVVGAISTAFVTWFVIVLICAECKSFVTPLTPITHHAPSTIEWVAAYGSMYVAAYLPYILTAAFFSYVARRAGRPGWGMVACALVAYFAFVNIYEVYPPTEAYNLSFEN